MKKATLLVTAACLSLLACRLLLQKNQPSIERFDLTSLSKDEDEEEFENEEAEQDGIELAQEQDFEATKDIRLGYIPKDRLIQASETLVRERRAFRANPGLRTSALSWTERGPNSDLPGATNGNYRGPGNNAVTSGRLRAILVDGGDVTNKTVWVGGADGGVWKTTDITVASPNWTPVNDALGNLAVSTICQDPTNANIMYFGTGEKSSHIDMVRGGGIWKSTDHGVTWNLIATTASYGNISKILCDASGNVYAATMGTGGLMRSTNGGTNWTSITPSGLSFYIADIKLSSTGRLHLVCGYGNSGTSGYRYTDNPATVASGTWTSPVTSFSSTAYNVELAASGSTVYALPANSSNQTPAVWKSTDGGANWAACATNPPVTGNSGADLSSGQGWYCLALAVDPANAANVVVGGLNTYRSADGGATWTQVACWVGTSMTYIHADQHYIVWKGSQVLIGTDGGIFYSANGGANWADRNTGLRLKQFYSCAIHPTSTNYFLAGAQDNGIHTLNNSGLGASTEVVGGDGMFTHIDQDQPQYQFGAYVYNDYRRSTNSGSSWNSVTYSSSIGSFINPTDYDDGNNRLYAGGAAGGYVRWEDPQTGSTFTPITIAAFASGQVSHVAVSPYTSNRVLFGMASGKIVRVDNAHLASPTAVDITGSGMNASNVSCIATGTTDNNLIATFSNYGAAHVWVSTSGGGAAAWTNISGNLPDIPVRWAVFYPYDNTKAIVATEAGVFETANINGSSTVWTQSAGFPIVRTDMLQYRATDNTLLAATHGRGLWTTTLTTPSPYIQFAASYASQSEGPFGTSGCRGYKDYAVNVNISKAPTGAAAATLNVSSATATNGTDFDFTTNGSFTTPSTVLNFASGTTTPQTVTIRVYDDASVESTETFTLGYTVSGTTDAVGGPSNQTYTFTLGDNDAAPSNGSSGVSGTIGSLTNGLAQPFDARLQTKRTQFVYLASELTAAGLTAGNISSLALNVDTKSSIRPFQNLQIKMGQTSSGYLYNGSFNSVGTSTVKSLSSYTTVAGWNSFVLDVPFAWNGTSHVVVEICYDNGSASAGDAADVLGGYSDGTTNYQMIWQDNITCATNFSSINGYSAGLKPQLTVQVAGTGNAVETTLNATTTSYLSTSDNVYFYNSGKIVARIQNGSAFNYGCTQVIVDRAGSGANAFWSSTAANYLARKTYRVVPTTNNASGSYTITLYYTAAEKAAWEAATGQLWSNIKIIKVKSQISNYTPATPGPDGANAVQVVTPVLGTYGPDYTVTGTFTTGFSGFGVGIPGTNPLPITLLDFKGQLDNHAAVLSWTTSSEQSSRDFDVEKSTDGINYYRIGRVATAGNSSTKRDYGYRDDKLSAVNYYRLRMNDVDGRNRLSGIVVLKYTAVGQKLWVVNNPFKSYLDVRLAKEAKTVRLQLINAAGSVMEEKSFVNPSGYIHWPLTNNGAAGTYVLRTVADGVSFTHKLIRQ